MFPYGLDAGANYTYVAVKMDGTTALNFNFSGEREPNGLRLRLGYMAAYSFFAATAFTI